MRCREFYDLNQLIHFTKDRFTSFLSRKNPEDQVFNKENIATLYLTVYSAQFLEVYDPDTSSKVEIHFKLRVNRMLDGKVMPYKSLVEFDVYNINVIF